MAVASSDSRVLLSSVEATLVEKIVSAFSNAIRYSQETIVVFRNFSSKFVNYRYVYLCFFVKNSLLLCM